MFNFYTLFFSSKLETTFMVNSYYLRALCLSFPFILLILFSGIKKSMIYSILAVLTTPLAFMNPCYKCVVIYGTVPCKILHIFCVLGLKVFCPISWVRNRMAPEILRCSNYNSLNFSLEKFGNSRQNILKQSVIFVTERTKAYTKTSVG